jgi:hypothetical protein
MLVIPRKIPVADTTSPNAVAKMAGAMKSNPEN